MAYGESNGHETDTPDSKGQTHGPIEPKKILFLQ